MTDDRDYLDAKFSGLEKLMTSHKDNLESYIGSVSANVKEVRLDLQAHKESYDAHGVGQAKSGASAIVAWVGLGLSAAVAMIEFAGKFHR